MSEETNTSETAAQPLLMVPVQRKTVDQTGIVPLEARLTTDSLVDIAVSNQEEILLANRQRLEKVLSGLQSQSSKLVKEHAEAAQVVVHTKYDPVVNQVKQIVKENGFSELHANFDITNDDDRQEVVFTITLASGPKLSGRLPMNPAMKEQINQAVELRKQITTTEGQLVEVKRALSEIPRLERRVRAVIANESLKNAGQAGKDLAARIEGVDLLTKNLPFLEYSGKPATK